MKYERPDWPGILAGLMKKKGIRQVSLAKKLGQRPQTIHNLLARKELKVSTIRKLSHVFGEDLFVHLLAQGNLAVLNKARAASVSSGEKNEILSQQAEVEELRRANTDQEARLEALTAETQELKASNANLAEELDKAVQQTQKQNETKQAELDHLRDKVRELEFDKKLQISVLEAKLEVLERIRNVE